MTDIELTQKFEETKYLIPYIYDRLLKSHKVRVNKEDVIAEGKVGLIQAIKNYDKDSGYSLSTFACCLIKNRMLNYIKSLSTKIVKNTCSNDNSNIVLSEYKGVDHFEMLDDNLCNKEIIHNLKKKINLIFEGLSEKDKLIFQNRLCGKSFSDIAKVLGISKQRVCERYSHTLTIVKKALVCINIDNKFPNRKSYADKEHYKSALKRYLRQLNQKEVDLKNNLKPENI